MRILLKACHRALLCLLGLALPMPMARGALIDIVSGNLHATASASYFGTTNSSNPPDKTFAPLSTTHSASAFNTVHATGQLTASENAAKTTIALAGQADVSSNDVGFTTY